MKIKFKTLFLSSVLVLSSVIAISSCSNTENPMRDNGTNGSNNEATPMPNNPQPDPNAATKTMLKTIAQGIMLNYENKIQTFAGSVNLEDAKAKFKPQTFDAQKYKLDIENVSSDTKRGIVDVTVKVSLIDGSVASDNVVLKVSGFRVSPIDFVLSQKDAIVAELNKPISRVSINVETSDVVIPSGAEAIDFSNPATFVKIGTFNNEFFDWLQMSMEQDSASLGLPPGTEELFSFSIFRDIWDKKPGSLDRFFNFPVTQALFSDTSGQLIPTGVDFIAEIRKIWEQEKTSFGFKDATFFVPTGTTPIDFTKSETFKAVFKTPPVNPRDTQGNILDTFDPLKNLGGAISEELRAILTAFAAKSREGLVLERDGNKIVSFVYYKTMPTS